MEPGELSANWKKLQQTLKLEAKQKGPNGTTGTKRKPTSRSGDRTIKRRRTDREVIPQRFPRAREDDAATHGTSRTVAIENDRKGTRTIATPNATHIDHNRPPKTTTEPREPAPKAGKYLALDCEMVGIGGAGSGPGPAGERESESILARASVVNYHGETVYDAYVQPTARVTDHRTRLTGIRRGMLTAEAGAVPFARARADVSALLTSRVLVGHDVRHDLRALRLDHPAPDVRDTSRFGEYRKLVNGNGNDSSSSGGGGGGGESSSRGRNTPGLALLSRHLLGVEIQRAGRHSSVEDARAAMALFRRDKMSIENEVARETGSRGVNAKGDANGGVRAYNNNNKGKRSKKRRRGKS